MRVFDAQEIKGARKQVEERKDSQLFHIYHDALKGRKPSVWQSSEDEKVLLSTVVSVNGPDWKICCIGMLARWFG